MMKPATRSARTDTRQIGAISRRGFLAGSGALLATGAMGSRLAFASPGNAAEGDVVILVFLRGGADGLNLVAPWNMASYKALRPTIRVKTAAELSGGVGAGLPLVSGGAVDPFALSGTFAMHPGLQRLYDTAWSNGDLAVVHAVGMPASESATRSHFESMRNWESGSASINVNTGFMNRFLQSIGATDDLSGIGWGSAVSMSLGGPVATYSMSGIDSFGVTGFADNARASDTLTSWYDSGTTDLVKQTGASTMHAVSTVRSIDWNAPEFDVQHGALYPSTDFAGALREVARLIRADVGLRVACIDVGGWDTHSDMGRPEDPNSYFRGRCEELAGGLAAFYTDMGPDMAEVTVATISEFGRTINENGTEGLDHGRATAMMVMGGGIKGGVHGPFVSSIADGPEDDLTVLTDYRKVLSEVLTVRGGASSATTIFPTWTPSAPLGLCNI